jgi:hypothetical protein
MFGDSQLTFLEQALLEIATDGCSMRSRRSRAIQVWNDGTS